MNNSLNQIAISTTLFYQSIITIEHLSDVERQHQHQHILMILISHGGFKALSHEAIFSCNLQRKFG